MVGDRAFLFHIYVPWGKTISLAPKSRSPVKVKLKYQGHSFRKKKKNGHCGGICVSQTHLVHVILQLSANLNALNVHPHLQTIVQYVPTNNCMYRMGDVYTHVGWDFIHLHQECVCLVMKHVTHVSLVPSITVTCVSLD